MSEILFEECFVDLIQRAELRCFKLEERFGNVKLTYNGNVVRCHSVVESGGTKEVVTLSVKKKKKSKQCVKESDPSASIPST